MDFKKYMHVERFGTTEVEGIENGMCFIFPKIDGTNSQLWYDGVLRAGSRNRELSLDKDNQGFMEWAVGQPNIMELLTHNPELRLYGEFLVPHTLRTYHKDAWRKYYVFDVEKDEVLMPYDEYKELLDHYGIEYIPPICKVANPTYERLVAQLDKNGYLIEDGQGTGEGIVIKNYSYKNKYGRTTWAKIVKNEFKSKHAKVDVTELKESKIVEQEIVEKFLTKSLVEKEYAKIEADGGWSSKNIPQLLNVVFYCLVKEDIWEIVKEFKRPTVNFKTLYVFSVNRTKELMPHLF